MISAPSIKEALKRIQDQIADLQGEHEVMAGPFDASKWKIEFSVADLQALVATLQPSGERREVIARIWKAEQDRYEICIFGGNKPCQVTRNGKLVFTGPDADCETFIRINCANALFASSLVQDLKVTKREALATAFAKQFPAILVQYSQYKIVDWFIKYMETNGETDH